MQQFTLLSHTADIKIHATADTKEQIFSAALHGMFCCMRSSHEFCRDDVAGDRFLDNCIERPVKVESGDIGALLVDFLSLALSYADVYDEAYFDVTVNELTETSLDATLKGVKVEGYDGVEIKAVTYHDLKFEKTEKGFSAEVVFDI